MVGALLELADVRGTAPLLARAGSVIGALTAFSTLVSWPLAIFHWGTKYVGSQSSRRLWGIAVCLGFFIGGWAYWCAGTRTKDEVRPEAVV